MSLQNILGQILHPRPVVLSDAERGLLVREGKVVAWLEPGRHWLVRKDSEIRKIRLDEAVTDATPELLAFVPAGAARGLFVPQGNLGLVSIDGVPLCVLIPGRYLLWQARASVTAVVVPTDGLIANELVPAAFRALCPAAYLSVVTVAAHERGLLRVDGVFQRSLEPGAWALFTNDRQVVVERVDLREREVPIAGQEVMTADKVTVRLNLVVRFQVTDPERSAQKVASIDAALYSEAQLVARRWVAGATVDQLLERRVAARDSMRAELGAQAETWGAKVLELDLKDVVLPGEMKTILNEVLVAEKRAAANVIARREETAATRSLMNTAKLLEQNPTLLRLKELEAYKEIAEKIDSLTVVAAPNELATRLSLPGAAR